MRAGGAMAARGGSSGGEGGDGGGGGAVGERTVWCWRWMRYHECYIWEALAWDGNASLATLSCC